MRRWQLAGLGVFAVLLAGGLAVVAVGGDGPQRVSTVAAREARPPGGSAAAATPATSGPTTAPEPMTSPAPAPAARTNGPGPAVAGLAALANLGASGSAGVAGAAATHLEGNGSGRIALAKPVPGAVVAQLTHGGSAEFTIHPSDASGQRRDPLVQTVGRYRGSRLLDADGQETTQLEVRADGPWSIDLVALPGAPTWTGREQLGGEGDAVYVIPGGLARFTVVQLTHAGSRAFTVRAYTAGSRDLVVNGVGRHDGRHALGAGIALLTVTADGPWSVTPR